MKSLREDETLVSPERGVKYEMLKKEKKRSKVLAALIQCVTEKDLFSVFFTLTGSLSAYLVGIYSVLVLCLII